MEKNKYIIKYLPTFTFQFNNILRHFVYELENKIAAESFYKEVINEIEKRSEFPKAFEIYKKTKNKNVNWYKIQIKNYIVFYTVKDNIMEISAIIYSKRNLDELI